MRARQYRYTVEHVAWLCRQSRQTVRHKLDLEDFEQVVKYVAARLLIFEAMSAQVERKKSS